MSNEAETPPETKPPAAPAWPDEFYTTPCIACRAFAAARYLTELAKHNDNAAGNCGTVPSPDHIYMSGLASGFLIRISKPPFALCIQHL